jgi:hypothetical protein
MSRVLIVGDFMRQALDAAEEQVMPALRRPVAAH